MRSGQRAPTLPEAIDMERIRADELARRQAAASSFNNDTARTDNAARVAAAAQAQQASASVQTP
jgi:hypothetical protein